MLTSQTVVLGVVIKTDGGVFESALDFYIKRSETPAAQHSPILAKALFSPSGSEISDMVSLNLGGDR